MRRAGAWAVVALVAIAPIAIAAASPLNAGRAPIWIVGSMAGIVALSLLFVQPLLAAGWLASTARSRRWHRIGGLLVLLAILAHVGGLFIYSPEDILDALLFVSPTPFAVYGVLSALLAMVLVAAALSRRLIPIPYLVWQSLHALAASAVAVTAVVHTLMIAGVMGELSKLVLCIATLATAAFATAIKGLAPLLRKRAR